MQKDLISVIIPTIGLRNIEKTLKSIKLQTYTEHELIIVEDKDRRGAPWARNKGAKKASGEYLLFLDDDVVLSPKFMETLKNELEKDKTFSFAYCNYRRTGFYNDIIKGNPFKVSNLLNDNFISTMSLVRASDFPGFDESLKRFQDWDLWLTITEKGGKGIWVDKVLFQAEYDGRGITDFSQDDAFFYRDIVRIKHGMGESVVTENYKIINSLRKELSIQTERLNFLNMRLDKVKNSRTWKLRNYLAKILGREEV